MEYKIFSTHDKTLLKKKCKLLISTYAGVCISWLKPHNGQAVEKTSSAVSLKGCVGWVIITCMLYDEHLTYLPLDTLVDRRNRAICMITNYKAQHCLLGIILDSVGLQQLTTKVLTRSNKGTDFVLDKAINKCVKKVFKYRVSIQ